MRIFFAAIFLFVYSTVSNAGTPPNFLHWQGTWDTNFGDIRLVPQAKGDIEVMVGDYADKGRLWGRLSKDGNTLRGYYVRYDGGWGLFEFNRKETSGQFEGKWQANGLPGAAAKKWDGFRKSNRRKKLRNPPISRANLPAQLNNPSKAFKEFWKPIVTSTENARESVDPIYIYDPAIKRVKKNTNWLGRYKTTFGEIRLWQEGSAVFGDYAKVGHLQGELSPDGQILRGIFFRYDLKWGLFEFKRTSNGFAGTWEFNRPPSSANSKKWNGEMLPPLIGGSSPVNLVNIPLIRKHIPRSIHPNPTGEIAEFLSFKFHHQAPPQPSPQAGDLEQGRWYGGYDTVGEGPSINIDVDHLRATLLVDASIGYYSVEGNGCPLSYHKAFCVELNWANANFGNGAGGQMEILGVMAEENEMFIAFRLPGNNALRLLALSYQGTRANPDYLMRIYHEQRGIDAEVRMKARAHLCEQTRCQGGRLDDLDRRGTNALGMLSNLQRFLSNFDPNRDERSQSHSSSRITPQPKPQPSPEPQQPVFNVGDRIHGDWELINEQGRNLGVITINAIGRRITGKGKLEETLLYGREVEVALEEFVLTDEAIRFEITYFSGESGEQDTRPLLLTLPETRGASMKGTLRTSQTFELVTLNWIGASSNYDFNEADENDLPGIGITGPAYTLINVPQGKKLKLRSGPGNTYDRTGSIVWNAEQVLVTECAPNIDTSQFESVGQNGKRKLLQGSWCNVRHGAGASFVQGFIPGKYLNPNVN